MKNVKIIAILGIILFFGFSIAQNIFPSDRTPEAGKVSLNPSQESSLIPTKSDQFVEYSEEKLASTDKSDIVLFFKAEWCHTCRNLEENINENLDKIPDDMIIMTVDFDSNRDLKNKYRVATQHSLVKIDQEGNKLDNWVGLPTLDSIINLV